MNIHSTNSSFRVPSIALTPFALAAIAVACSSSPSEDTVASKAAVSTTVGSEQCPAGQTPNGLGTCQPCQGIIVTGMYHGGFLNSTVLTGQLQLQSAYYKLANGSATFYPGPYLASHPNLFSSGPLSPPTIPPVNGSTVTIPNLTIDFNDWTLGANLVVSAVINGEIDVQGAVSPTAEITNLPITMTLGTDNLGSVYLLSATGPTTTMGSYVDVSGCGLLGWCDGSASGALDTALASEVPSMVGTQLVNALNGNEPSPDGGLPNITPFFQALVNGIMSNGVMPDDPTGALLPSPNQAVPGGQTTSWSIVGGATLDANGDFSASYGSSPGLCYIDCTPKTEAQACASGPVCGPMSDGCGGTYNCANTCAAGQECNGSACCTPTTTCASKGADCGNIVDNCGVEIYCGGCGENDVCDNNVCMASGNGGPTGPSCSECVATHGICHIGPGNVAICIHE